MREICVRRVILNLHNQGDTQKKIAVALGLTQGRVSQIIKEEKRNYHGGEWGGHKPCKLNDTQLHCLKKYLGSSAEEFGFVGEHWNAPRLKKLIWDKFGITYHVSSIYPLLRRLGYSPQKYTTVDYRQDETAVETFVEETLPKLKKKRNKKTE
jgi:transposase